MRISRWVGAGAGVALLGSVLFAADATDPAAAKPRARVVRLVKPWSDLASLSEEQKGKILEIHGKANDEVRAVHTKEQNDIMALLTEDQKKELAADEAKATAAAKLRRAHPGAATQPGADEMAPAE